MEQAVASPAPDTTVGQGSAPQRPQLPCQNVSATSIEEAYVDFILHCNPAVPLCTDTAALREAFRSPPKSGGKTFSTFTLFELIQQLESRKVKTWADLALKLGVEPPDREKGESSQKIQQYAVRLKRWMHSMHLDAFFEYLLGRQHAYWTRIPFAFVPVTECERDGVAAEDDMALRALLPHIRPRRGRRKADEEETTATKQRPSPGGDDHSRDGPGLWPATSDRPYDLPAGQSPASAWDRWDGAHTAWSGYVNGQAHSAVTPSTRTPWADEPRSAITPTRPKHTAKRHGAKAVSSAWRGGGLGAGGKIRGRPPMMHRGNADGNAEGNAEGNADGNTDGKAAGNADGSFSTFPIPDAHRLPRLLERAFQPPSRSTPTPARVTVRPAEPIPCPVAPVGSEAGPGLESRQREAGPSRASKRSRLSLQVPERVGQVRPATPVPPTQPDEAGPRRPGRDQGRDQSRDHGHERDQENGAPASKKDGSVLAGLLQEAGRTELGNATLKVPTQANNPPSARQPKQAPASTPWFPTAPDRTNMQEVEAYFVGRLMGADWRNAQDKASRSCCVAEAVAISRYLVENIFRAAPNQTMFLVNLSALLGGQILMTTRRLVVQRLDELEDRTKYSFDWELRLGDIRANYSLELIVLHERWKVKAENKAGGDEAGSAEYWQHKYMDMCRLVQERDEQLADMKNRVMEMLRADMIRARPGRDASGDANGDANSDG